MCLGGGGLHYEVNRPYEVTHVNIKVLEVLVLALGPWGEMGCGASQPALPEAATPSGTPSRAPQPSPAPAVSKRVRSLEEADLSVRLPYSAEEETFASRR